MLCCSQFSQLKVVFPTENLLKNFCMMNPPVRRGGWCTEWSLMIVSENDAGSVAPG